MSSDSQQKVTKEYLINDDNFFPNTQAKRALNLPAGAYTCKVTIEGDPYFEPIKIVTDEIIDIPTSFTMEVVSEIEQFWSNGVSEKFKQYGLVHKRGILLEGVPGTGKTITLAKAAKTVIEKFNGVVLFNPQPKWVAEFIKLIKDIEPDKRVMVMWEEFDSFLSAYESDLLSLLDGELQVGNIMFLATTNYITRVPSRIKNRPSRFARIISVSAPNVEARTAFLDAKLQGEDRKHLPAMVEASDGFVIDQLKDLIISVCCFGFSISDAVMKIKEMRDDSMGLDDFQEEQAKEVFAQKTTNPVIQKGPLKPLR